MSSGPRSFSNARSREPPVEEGEASDSELLRFHELIRSNHPEALRVRDEFIRTSDNPAFQREVIRLCRPQLKQKQQLQPQKSGQDAAPAASNRPSEAVAKSQQTASKKICRNFEVGNCSRSNCKFLHQASAEPQAEVPRKQSPAGKAPASKSKLQSTSSASVVAEVAAAAEIMTDSPAPQAEAEIETIKEAHVDDSPMIDDLSPAPASLGLLSAESLLPSLMGLGLGGLTQIASAALSLMAAPPASAGGRLSASSPPGLSRTQDRADLFEENPNLLKGSKLFGDIELEYLLDGIPGFQSHSSEPPKEPVGMIKSPQRPAASMSSRPIANEGVDRGTSEGAYFESEGDRSPPRPGPPGWEPEPNMDLDPRGFPSNGPPPHFGMPRWFPPYPGPHSGPPPRFPHPPPFGMMPRPPMYPFPGFPGPYPMGPGGGPPPFPMGMPPPHMMPPPPFPPQFMNGHPMFNPNAPMDHPMFPGPMMPPPHMFFPPHGFMHPGDFGPHPHHDGDRDGGGDEQTEDREDVSHEETHYLSETKPEEPPVVEDAISSAEPVDAIRAEEPPLIVVKTTDVLASVTVASKGSSETSDPTKTALLRSLIITNKPASALVTHEVPVKVAEDTPPVEETAKKAVRVIKSVPWSSIQLFIKQNQDFSRPRGGKPLNTPVSMNSPLGPNQPMIVEWELPFDLMDKYNKGQGTLVLGLIRMATASNNSCVVAKKISESKKMSTSDIPGSVNGKLIKGDLNFFAPKAAGTYVFRIFDNSTKDAAINTIATSQPFVVQISGRDVTTNLRYAMDLLKKQDSETMGLVSLRSAVEGMAGPGTRADNDTPEALLDEAVATILSILHRSMVSPDSYAEAMNTLRVVVEAEAAAQESIVPELLSSEETPVEGVEKAESKAVELIKSKVSGDKLHSEALETIVAMKNSKIVCQLLSPERVHTLNMLTTVFCPLLNRFFSSPDAIQRARLLRFGHIMAPYSTHLSPQSINAASHALMREMDAKLATLFPSNDFWTQRDEVRMRLLSWLTRSGAISGSVTLEIFGSSKNGFGSNGADLDMCIMPSGGLHHFRGTDSATAIREVIERIGTVLRDEAGMKGVEIRSTARIPIVLFKDTVTGIDCDISFTNPLAIRNTELLLLYSAIDPRVRQLAYIIKHWAKSRDINDPRTGTMGSYGLILCLIQFLQTRNPPVLPSLQQLPPSWSWEFGAGGAPVPQRWERHPVETETECNTYFYSPAVVGRERAQDVLKQLRAFAAMNRQSSAELLLDFFGYYAWAFDFKRQVVSVRTGRPISKVDKTEYSCWPPSERLSVEDPFETWYDVAHVIKSVQMERTRAEFARAHTLMTRYYQCMGEYRGNADLQALGDSIERDLREARARNEGVLSALCSPVAPPASEHKV